MPRSITKLVSNRLKVASMVKSLSSRYAIPSHSLHPFVLTFLPLQALRKYKPLYNLAPSECMIRRAWTHFDKCR